MSELLTITEAAQRIGASVSLLQKRCKDGTLPAIRVGKHYRVRLSDVEDLVRHTPRLPQVQSSLSNDKDVLYMVEAWVSYLTHVRAVSPNTIRTYQGHVQKHFQRLAFVGVHRLTIEALYDRGHLLAVFSGLPTKSYALKLNTFNALLSLGRFLVMEAHIKQELVDAIKPLKPRQFSEPRRTHLKNEDVPRLFQIILSRPFPMEDNLAFAAIVGCMVYTGLRVSEVCKLRPEDVDLDARTLQVRCGKGGKDRKVGINSALYGYLVEYTKIRTEGLTFFNHHQGRRWSPLKLARRMNTVSKRMGVDITCHGLRRTFATLAASQGRSVNYLRIALGHATLSTTQSYLRHSEAEVVEAMKTW